VATIAYRVARAIPASRLLIETAIDIDPMIFQQSIDTQLAKFIIEPLQSLHSTGFAFKDSPFVIVIDGLDECKGTDVQSGLVKSLAVAFFHSPLRIRILIASRPEVYLQSTFNSSSVQPHLSRLALSNECSAQEDIHRFLKDSFEKMRREHPLASYIPSPWPSAEVLDDITRKSSGQFIFASTTVKYVGGDPYELPTRRLDVIRRLQSPEGEEDLPYADLNSLYHHLLSKVRNIERVKLILGAMDQQELVEYDLSFDGGVEALFSWQPGETKACLSQLASLIECDADGYITILHASLFDFLFDPSRSRQFHLCRESVLGDLTAVGLRKLSQQHLRTRGVSFIFLYFQALFLQCSFATFFILDYENFRALPIDCIRAGSSCSPRLREELNQISFRTLYRVYERQDERGEVIELFWELASEIIEMLHSQVGHVYPQLAKDLPDILEP